MQSVLGKVKAYQPLEDTLKSILPAPLVLLLSVSAYAMDDPQDLQRTRIAIAKEYLHLLTVSYSGELSIRQKPDIVRAFETWRTTPDEKLKAEANAEVEGTLIPNVAARLLRVSTFNTDWAQQPQFVSGVPEGSFSSAQAQIVRNPNYALWSFGGTINPSELYVSIADRTALCDAAGKVWKNTAALNCYKEEYLAASRKRDMWARFGAATTVLVNTSQVPRFQSGTLLPQSTISRGRDYTFTVQGSFDPVLLFRTPSEWDSWAEYYSGHKNDLPGEVSRLQALDPKSGSFRRLAPSECLTKTEIEFPLACVKRLSAGPKWHQTLTTLIPKVNVKAYTAFDFFKTGLNTFAPTDRSGRALYDITATWDLRKVIPSAQARIQAFKATRALTSPRKEPEKLVAGWKAHLQMMYLELLNDPAIVSKDDWWNELRNLVLKGLADK